MNDTAHIKREVANCPCNYQNNCNEIKNIAHIKTCIKMILIRIDYLVLLNSLTINQSANYRICNQMSPDTIRFYSEGLLKNHLHYC
jgi:hypothetical protein